MSLDLPRLIAALRDTADKATATATVRVPTDRMWDGSKYTDGYDSTTDKYSRDWVAGRLLGMADTLEAMLGLADTMTEPSHGREGTE